MATMFTIRHCKQWMHKLCWVPFTTKFPVSGQNASDRCYSAMFVNPPTPPPLTNPPPLLTRPYMEKQIWRVLHSEFCILQMTPTAMKMFRWRHVQTTNARRAAPSMATVAHESNSGALWGVGTQKEFGYWMSGRQRNPVILPTLPRESAKAPSTHGSIPLEEGLISSKNELETTWKAKGKTRSPILG